LEAKAQVETFAEFTLDPANLMKQNSRILKNEVVHEYNKTSMLIHRVSEGKLVVSNRDFCLFFTQIQLQDESVANISFSIEHEKVPISTDAVRGEMTYQVVHAKFISDTE
jgi:hypothetical protein